MPKTKAVQTDSKKDKKPKQIKKDTSPTIPVYGLDGKEEKKIIFPKEIFLSKTNSSVLAQYIRVYLTNQRQGTASAKTRGQVSGSTRKIYRQKGTGRARHGDIKAPIFIGGGVVGGPKPKEYSLKINKKQAKKALFCALSLKLQEKAIIGLIDKFLNIRPKTKAVVEFLKKTDLADKKILLILPKMEKNNLMLAARNLPNIELVGATSINPYTLLKNQKILLLENSLSIITNHFLKNEN